MFAYSLTGLEISDDAAGGVLEVEESEITARSAVYQVLGRIFTKPDTEHYEMALNGQWIKELTEGAELLDFDWDIGDVTLDSGTDKAAFVAEYDRLFGPSDSGNPLWGGSYADDRERVLTDLGRAYEYYGLGSGGDDAMPADHLASELDFMQFLTFKEAAASSPRLGKSFRRAQKDFVDKQLNWIDEFSTKVSGADPSAFWAWATERLATFVAADKASLG